MNGAFRLGAIAAAAAGAVPGPPPGPQDPHWAKERALLHLDGADGGTSFPDVTGRAWSIVTGTPKLTTTDPKFGSACIVLDGGAISASVPAFAAGDDFCIEMWAKTIATRIGAFFVLKNSGGSVVTALWSANSGVEVRSAMNGYGSQGNYTMTRGAWTHIALARKAGTLRMFVGGVARATHANAVGAAGGATVWIGHHADIGGTGAGHADEFRLTIGEARYDAAFTPPDAPFPNF